MGPAAAVPGAGQPSGAGGYADIFNLQTMTILSLAFAATTVRALKSYSDHTGSLIFRRHVTPFPPSQNATGRSKAALQDSTI